MTIGEVLLQGLVTGMTVVIGVVLAEALIRRRERRQRIQSLVLELGMLLPKVLVPFTGIEGERPVDLEEHSRLHELVISSLAEIRFKAHGMSRASKVRRETELLSGKVTAAWQRWWRGDGIAMEDVLKIRIQPLQHAVFGPQKNLDQMWRHFDEHGLDADDTAPPSP